MIDNEEKARALMAKVTAALPFRVRLAPEDLRSMKRNMPGLQIDGTVEVQELIYAGDMGGIMCLLVFGKEHDLDDTPEEVQIVSVTHLTINRNLPFWSDVAKYKNRRIKRLRQQNGSMTQSGGMHW